MPTPTPLHLILAAAPEAPGARALLGRAAAEAERGRPWRVLLTDDGLAWASDDAGAALLRKGAEDVALCSRSARDRGLGPEALPSWVRWSSLVSWLTSAVGHGDLWTALP